jgi:hypothetical protein
MTPEVAGQRQYNLTSDTLSLPWGRKGLSCA